MKKLYFLISFFCSIILLFPSEVFSQCGSLVANAISYESRCAATGAIKIYASGGSGSYKYRTIGPVNTNYTSTDSITGLSAGVYAVQVNDIITNCNFTINNVVVKGTYKDPRFTLNKLDVSCNNVSNGSIFLATQLFGLTPFIYTIVAPSVMGVGTSNSTGNFPNLSAGNYFIRLTDSCGGIQTRQITINNYTWDIVEYPFTKISCYEASGYIKVTDSRGNISTVSGIPGFMYGIVRSPGDTLWSANPNFTFPLVGSNSFEVIAKDSCGFIKKGPVQINLDQQVGASVLINNKICSTFSATLINTRNFIAGQFCLYDNTNALIDCNSTGSFNDIPYGNYCIQASDICADTIISRCFSVTPPTLSLGNTVLISNKTCATFTAKIIDVTGLTNPEYCLYDSSDILISCNTSGIFDNLSYGNYCINAKDGCRDTTITRCFIARRPVPFIPPIRTAYINCINFGIITGGDSLSNPQYCLYDSAGLLITCNNTGIFDSLLLGTYCVNIYDSCYDTTIIRCITVGMPVVQNNLIYKASRKTCSTFALITSGAGLTKPLYCLYTAADSLVECNTTGVFYDLLYGSYCVKARNGCPDTLLTLCFTEGPPVPAVDATVAVSKNSCTSFTATVRGQINLTKPQYCIYDTANNLLSCNTTGVFDNLLFGSYCIKINNNCYDTTITRCFTKLAEPVDISVVANKSCAFNYAKFTISLSGTTLPVNIIIYKPDGSVFLTRSFLTTNFSIDSIPGVPVGDYYKVVAQDACSNKDSATTGATGSFFNFTTTVTPKCPGASWANGSANIAMTITSNMGSVSVRIIKKDGVAYNSPLVPNTAWGGVFTFTDLGPGIYILRSSENICNQYVYDTIAVNAYLFPNLNRSSAYQCDEGGFSVSAVAGNGVAPFTYQIIGSVPSFPGIISAPQPGSVFNISNGTSYSLIRLRALDACGNATLGDASILPLRSYGITATANCLFYPTTLSVDTIINADYKWYKKISATASDSIFIGTGPGYYIPDVLPADTGTYVCYMNVNQGCIKRTYVYNLNGSCYIVLPLKLLEFKGRQEENKHVLFWKTTQEQNLANFIIERQTVSSNFFEIATTAARNGNGLNNYQFADLHPAPGKNYYRLKMQNSNGTYTYSNIIVLQKKKAGLNFSVYPNPVKDRLSISFSNTGTQQLTISLFNLSNQLIFQKDFSTTGDCKIEIPRPDLIPGGLYFLRIINITLKEQVTEKLIFL